MKPRRLSRRIVYESRWVNLYLDKVRFTDGRVIDPFHMLDFELEAVAALVEDDGGALLLVQAYRYPTDTVEWEVPAGIVEPGDSVLDTARREAWEESGYETTDHACIYSYYPLIGMANKRFHIVHCRAEARTGDLDRGEVAGFKWVPRQEIADMVAEGTIQDGFTLTALLLDLMR